MTPRPSRPRRRQGASTIRTRGAVDFGRMARRAEAIPDDPVLVVIDDGEPEMSFDEWLELLNELEPTDIDANAADILREIREHGER